MGRARGLTLLEVMVAVAVMVIALLGIAASSLTSVRSAAQSQQLIMANQAANDLVERLRARPFATVHAQQWADPSLGTTTISFGDVLWVESDPNGALAATRAAILDPAFDRGVLKPPRFGPPIAYRFLNEMQHNDLWGTATDLDGDGTDTSLLPDPGSGSPDPGYGLYSLVVVVRWSDGRTDWEHEVTAVLAPSDLQDPRRG